LGQRSFSHILAFLVQIDAICVETPFSQPTKTDTFHMGLLVFFTSKCFFSTPYTVALDADRMTPAVFSFLNKHLDLVFRPTETMCIHMYLLYFLLRYRYRNIYVNYTELMSIFIFFHFVYSWRVVCSHCQGLLSYIV